ncbi:DUF2249 domain-containing protein [Pseudogracilibacillus auburnensis]|uniref:DUF2249 domain-containing protein n=1 Tax=Pseudogracilibacillus auburnensis TaxID=1494959 RepID=UPI001D52DB90|nr:DUF2249 domain-containing protein [Pseudogracilibacillus auburnensis]
MMETKYKETINAPEIESKYRHPFILETFDSLASGEFLQLKNDHDPRPLHYQFMQERTDLFTWEYLEEGPAIWRVAIGKR